MSKKYQKCQMATKKYVKHLFKVTDMFEFTE